MRQDKILKHDANVILSKIPTEYTFLIEIADELLGGRALISSVQLLLQMSDLRIPNLEECSHLLILEITG